MANFEPSLFKISGGNGLESELNSILEVGHKVKIAPDNKRFHFPLPRPGMPLLHISFGGITYEIQLTSPQGEKVVGKVSIVGYDNDPNMLTANGFYEEVMAFRTCKPLSFKRGVVLPASYIFARRVRQDRDHVVQPERKDYWDPRFFSKASGESPLLRKLIPDYMFGAVQE